MNYEEKRASLVAQAQKHIDKGEISEANAIMRDIRTLDEKHEESVTAAANLAALNNVQNVSANPIASIGQGVLLTDEGQCISESAGDDKMNIFGTVEYRTAFMNKILNDKPLPEKYTNAAATTTSTTAGTIVPTTLYEKISTKLEQVGEIYSRIFRTSYPTALVIPISDIKPEANWVDEDKGTDAQKHSADKVTFAGYKLECKTAFSLFISQTSLEIFEAQFVELYGEAMIKAIEKAVLTGSGAGCPKGLLKETPPAGQAITVGKSEKLSYNLLCKAEGALPAAYDGVWLMTKKTFWDFIGITDTNGQPVARINAGINGNPECILLGRHVCFTDCYMENYADTVSADTMFAAIFDLSNYVLNEVMGIVVKKYIDEDTDNTKIKAVMLADGKAVDLNSLVTLTKQAAS